MPPPRRAQEIIAEYLRAPSRRRNERCSTPCVSALEPRSVAGLEVAHDLRFVAGLRRRRLQPGAQDRRSHRRAGPCLPRGDGRPRLLRRAHALARGSTRPAIAAVLGGGGHQQAASAVHRGSLAEARELVSRRPSAGRSPAPDGGGDHVPPRALRGPRRLGSQRRWCCGRADRQSGIFVGDPQRLGRSRSRASTSTRRSLTAFLMRR